MILACHQPLYLPWPGLFYKAMVADVLILLDHVDFPMGRSWISRNRLKNHQGAFWLTVPVKKKGRRSDPINTIEIYDERDWRKKHLQSIIQSYSHAPYLEDHQAFFNHLYGRPWTRLIDLNLVAFDYLKNALGISTPVKLSSTLKLSGRGADLLVNACRAVGADTFLVLTAAMNYLDEKIFSEAGITLRRFQLDPPVYPQLFGDFVSNLSVLDMLLCCGPKSRTLIEKSGHLLV